MLNPSTADGQGDDPTIRKCVGFAQRWGYDRMKVVNLFAYRATDPRVLLSLPERDDPFGVRNQEIIDDAAFNSHLIVCAWGAHGHHLGQDKTVLGWLDRCTSRHLHIFGLTKDGHPRHPLMIGYDTPLVQVDL